MSISRQEELLCALWAVASLIAFGNGFTTWGAIFAVKSVLDLIGSLFLAVKEINKGQP